MIASSGYQIVPAESAHLSHLNAIELAAAQLLRGYAPARVLQETTSDATFERAAADGRLWVAVADGDPIGFAVVEMLADGSPHLEEVDVDPAHGRRGAGTALVRACCDWTFSRGYPSLSLTAFRDPPFNMPFYARLGFVEVPAPTWSPALQAVVANEAARGLPAGSRVVMRYDASAVIRLATAQDRDALFDVWLRSARATHTFVPEDQLQLLMAPTRAYLASAAEMWVLCAPTGPPIGFMGLAGSSLESLFLVPEVLRRGFGRRLVSHARQLLGSLRVDVNEQNHAAVLFYKACGFVVDGRSEVDDEGRPYPLLHMRTGETVDGCTDRDVPQCGGGVPLQNVAARER